MAIEDNRSGKEVAFEGQPILQATIMEEEFSCTVYGSTDSLFL